MATRAPKRAALGTGTHDVDDLDYLDAVVVRVRLGPGDIEQFCGVARECAGVGC